MQDNVNRRRFIAGAVCPRCARMDKIVVDLETEQRECVSCGFSEGRPENHPPEVATGRAERVVGQSRELPTRVSRAAARRVETPAEVITLLDEGKTAVQAPIPGQAPMKPDAT